MKGYEYEIKAIPTMFQGIQMRSRLEARWAAFFTACGWEWTYEPFDFEGWSPDFLLKLHRPVFVEVKPEITTELANELRVVSQKIREGGARVLLVGDSIIYPKDEESAFIGIGAGEGSWSEDDAPFDDISLGECGGRCGCHPVVGMSPAHADYHCWVCDGHDGKPAGRYRYCTDVPDIAGRWAKACNDTQWHPR